MDLVIDNIDQVIYLFENKIQTEQYSEQDKLLINIMDNDFKSEEDCLELSKQFINFNNLKRLAIQLNNLNLHGTFFKQVFKQNLQLEKVQISIFAEGQESKCISELGSGLQFLINLNYLSINIPRQNHIEPEGYLSLSKSIKMLKNLTNLQLQIQDNENIMMNEAIFQHDMFQNLIHLQILSLEIGYGNMATSSSVHQLSEGLFFLKQLKNLQISISEIISPKGISDIYESLTSLQDLEIFKFFNPQPFALIFISLIKQLKLLKILQNNFIKDFFFQRLDENKNAIESIDLIISSNQTIGQLGEQGLRQSLAKLPEIRKMRVILEQEEKLKLLSSQLNGLSLINNEKLIELDIQIKPNNYISQEGVKGIGESLQLMKSLIQFDLQIQSNQITSLGITYIAQGLRCLKQLQDLKMHLESNGITEEGALQLGQANSELNNLISFYLLVIDNNIQSQGAISILEGLRKMNKLKSLQIHFNKTNLGIEFQFQFAEILKDLTQINKFYLSIMSDANEFSKEGIISLCNTIKSLNKLQDVQLNLDTEFCIYFINLIEQRNLKRLLIHQINFISQKNQEKIDQEKYQTSLSIQYPNCYLSNNGIEMFYLAINSLYNFQNLELSFFIQTNIQISILQLMLNSLKQQNQLSNLRIQFDNNFYDKLTYKEIGNNISRLTQLKNLSIKVQNNEWQNAEGIIQVLNKLVSLKSLKLQFFNSDLNDNILKQFGCQIQLLPELEYLSLEIIQSNYLTINGYDEMVKGFSNLHKLNIIQLNFNQLESIYLFSLLYYIRDNTSLEYVKLPFIQRISYQLNQSIIGQNNLYQLSISFLSLNIHCQLNPLFQALAQFKNVNKLILSLKQPLIHNIKMNEILGESSLSENVYYLEIKCDQNQKLKDLLNIQSNFKKLKILILKFCENSKDVINDLTEFFTIQNDIIYLDFNRKFENNQNVLIDLMRKQKNLVLIK